MSEFKFTCDYAKMGTASCRKCKQKLDKGGFRLGKLVTNPFSDDGGEMKQWFHPKCLFQSFEKARATTKKIEDTDDIDNFDILQTEDQDLVKDLINGLAKNASPSKKDSGKKTSPTKTTLYQTKLTPEKPLVSTQGASKNSPIKGQTNSPVTFAGDNEDPSVIEKDNAFRTYRKLCAEIAEESSHLGKTKILSDMIKNGASGVGYKGDLYMLFKLLLPGIVKRVYNLKDKQIVKLFSTIFRTNKDQMMQHLEQGDVAETIRVFFETSKAIIPSKKSELSMRQVDTLLEELSSVTKEEDQEQNLTKIARQCTSNDLKMVVRLIKHDLKINAGSKAIMDALDTNAYAAFQSSRNLHDVISRVKTNREEHGGKPGLQKAVSVRASLCTPVLPMLAEACKSVEMAMAKCPKGMYSEIKYDGERVQVHKTGDTFHYFSRSLKTVAPHKVQHFKDYIPKAFPGGDSLIIDAEVLMVDTKTGKQLPFGSLGIHKRNAFKDASVCLFVFDCLHINGENLMDKPMKERRRVLESKMVEVKNHIMFSEQKFITDPQDLKAMMNHVFSEGLEGLVLKDINGIYEPGKRHWLKVKKDYLMGGAMADSADLVVLGAYYGTGTKGGMMSVFLMGSYNPKTKKFCTVTKVGNGHDDATLKRLQTELKMVKIRQDFSKIPSWLNINKSLTPDFVTADPKTAPVWEITGAEFSHSDAHTAGGISIRFPRVTRIRDDKTWEEATDVQRLADLFKTSKEKTDFLPMDEEKGGSKGRKKRPASDIQQEAPSTSKRVKSDTVVPGPISYGSNTLRSLFTGMTIYLPASLVAQLGDDMGKLRRYLIAYDADIVDSTGRTRATHQLIKDQKVSPSGDLPPVSVDWVWQCIKKKRLLPTT